MTVDQMWAIPYFCPPALFLAIFQPKGCSWLDLMGGYVVTFLAIHGCFLVALLITVMRALAFLSTNE